MSDFAGCIRTTSITINPLVTLSVSPFVFQPACGLSNGSINLVIAGGTPTYNIIWNPPAGSTTSLSGLNTGVYSYTVTESGTNSCSISQAINISNSNGPVIDALQTNVACFGTCTGSISAMATGTSSPLTYAWSTGANSQNVIDLCKGVVTLSVTDGGCLTMKTFTITENPLLQFSLPNVLQPNCFGNCDGIINLLPNGGVQPYSYAWDGLSKTSNPIDSLCDGTYSATVTDAKGCQITSKPLIISSISNISITANTFNSSCISVADGSISLTASGGVVEYEYDWTGPMNFVDTTQNISNVLSGLYSVTIKDALGCKIDTILSIVPSITVVANAGLDQTICPETGSVVLTVVNSSGANNFKWFNLNDKNKSKPLATGASLLVENLTNPEGYIVVVTATVPSCFSEDTVNVNLHVLPPVDAGQDLMMPVHASVTIGGFPSSWGATSIKWAPAIYLNDSTSSNPIASNTVNVTYTLTVTDANGCIAKDTVHVFLYPKLNITSGFTPNNDGKNDLWIIDYIDQFPNTTVDIFNRWGDLIFNSNGYQIPFDGKYKGTDLPVGTYYYVIKLNHPGYPKPITGPLTIFR